MSGRRTLWQGQAKRIDLLTVADGSIALVCSTDYDSGPSKSVTIPAEALAAVSSALFSESLARMFQKIGATIRAEIAEQERRRRVK